MADVDTIRQLNNTAATNLADGDIDTALSLLSLALEDLRMDLHRETDNDRVQDPPAESTLDPFMVPVHKRLCVADLCFSPNNAFQVYKKAFILPASESEFDGIAIALMYNFGLVLQRKGIVEGHDETLKRAKKMYSMCSFLLDLMQDRGRQSSHIVTMALWNNLGHLHSHFWEMEEVGTCKEKIRLDLSRVGNTLSSEDFVFFHQTVLFLDTCNVASLAGAA